MLCHWVQSSRSDLPSNLRQSCDNSLSSIRLQHSFSVQFFDREYAACSSIVVQKKTLEWVRCSVSESRVAGATYLAILDNGASIVCPQFNSFATLVLCSIFRSGVLRLLPYCCTKRTVEWVGCIAVSCIPSSRRNVPLNSGLTTIVCIPIICFWTVVGCFTFNFCVRHNFGMLWICWSVTDFRESMFIKGIEENNDTDDKSIRIVWFYVSHHKI